MSTKHKYDCNMAFGKKDPSCPRCIELLNGSPARQGWQGSYFKRKAELESVRSAAIKAHYGPNGGCRCGVVCTAFDW